MPPIPREITLTVENRPDRGSGVGFDAEPQCRRLQPSGSLTVGEEFRAAMASMPVLPDNNGRRSGRRGGAIPMRAVSARRR